MLPMSEPVPTIISKPTLLQQQHMEVYAEDELVCIQIGNSTLKMHYNDALKISQWIRVRAKEAKANAGDTSHHWSLVGNLGALDHNGEPIKPKKRRSRK